MVLKNPVVTVRRGGTEYDPPVQGTIDTAPYGTPGKQWKVPAQPQMHQGWMGPVDKEMQAIDPESYESTLKGAWEAPFLLLICSVYLPMSQKQHLVSAR